MSNENKEELKDEQIIDENENKQIFEDECNRVFTSLLNDDEYIKMSIIIQYCLNDKRTMLHEDEYQGFEQFIKTPSFTTFSDIYQFVRKYGRTLQNNVGGIFYAIFDLLNGQNMSQPNYFNEKNNNNTYTYHELEKNINLIPKYRDEWTHQLINDIYFAFNRINEKLFSSKQWNDEIYVFCFEAEASNFIYGEIVLKMNDLVDEFGYVVVINKMKFVETFAKENFTTEIRTKTNSFSVQENYDITKNVSKYLYVLFKLFQQNKNSKLEDAIIKVYQNEIINIREELEENNGELENDGKINFKRRLSFRKFLIPIIIQLAIIGIIDTVDLIDLSEIICQYVCEKYTLSSQCSYCDDTLDNSILMFYYMIYFTILFPSIYYGIGWLFNSGLWNTIYHIFDLYIIMYLISCIEFVVFTILICAKTDSLKDVSVNIMQIFSYSGIYIHLIYKFIQKYNKTFKSEFPPTKIISNVEKFKHFLNEFNE